MSFFCAQLRIINSPVLLGVRMCVYGYTDTNMKSQSTSHRHPHTEHRRAYTEHRMILATDRFLVAESLLEKEKARKWAYAWRAFSRKLV
jgi:hypothetical protein